MNKIILSGNLGGDATAQVFNEKQVVNFSLAVQDNYKNGKGEWVDRVVWFNCTMWTSRPITRLVKGAKVVCEGRIRHESYIDRNGVERWQMKVTLEGLEIMHSPVSAQYQNQPQAQQAPIQQSQENNIAPEPKDDLPF